MTNDPYHDAERFGVVRYSDGYFVVIDKLAANRVYARHYSSRSAHEHADDLNAQHRAERSA